MWLRDSLPSDLPGAQILIYGYNTKLLSSFSFQDLEALATTFRESLEALRGAAAANYGDTKSRRPLIFIAHSLGGLVLKEALIQMSRGTKSDRETLNSTYGILFFGVPSRGMDIKSLIPIVGDQANLAFLYSLGKESQLLRNQSRDFAKAFDFPDSEVVYFYETMMSPMAEWRGTEWKMTGPRKILVDSTSATHGRPWETEAHHIHALNREHSDLVKFSIHDSDYDRVLAILKRLTLTAKLAPLDEKPALNVEQRRRYLDSLRFDHIDANYATTKPAHAKTCKWLLKRHEYES